MTTPIGLRTLTALTLLNIAVGLPQVSAHAALPQQKAAVDSPAMTDLKAAVLAGEIADKLFLEKKWAEALNSFNAAEAKFATAIKRDPDMERLNVTWKPTSLPAAGKYGYIQTVKTIPGLRAIEHSNAPIRENGMAVYELRSMLNDMRTDALVFSGKAIPFVDDGDHQTDEVDVELLGRHAANLGVKLDLPLPDDQWEGAIALLNRAVLRLEYVLAQNPKWKMKEMREWGAIGKKDPTGNEALEIVRAKLKEAQSEVDKANGRLAKIVPSGVTVTLDRISENLNTILERVKTGSYYDVDDAGLVGGATRAAEFKQHRKYFAEEYAKEGKTMPDDIMKPWEDKIAEVNAMLDKKASGYTFETKTPALPMITETVRKAIVQKYPGAQVVRAGVRGSGWNVYRTDLGILTGRGREGSVLYKLPGEKWYREQLFTYVQDNTGGDSYSPNGRVGLGNLLRFESGK